MLSDPRSVAAYWLLRLPQRYDVEPRFQPLYAPGEYTVTVASFVAQAPDGWEPTLNHEHDDYRWCSFDDALALLYWPEMKDSLRAVAAHLARVRRPCSGTPTALS